MTPLMFWIPAPTLIKPISAKTKSYVSRYHVLIHMTQTCLSQVKIEK